MNATARLTLGALCLVSAVATLQAQPVELVERGRKSFRVHCQTCHGEAGRGDGPMAELLRVRPADLTRIARRHGGEFPFTRIYHVIDGRADVRGHGGREMPIWGLSFRERGRDDYQEDEVRGHILQLIYYLQSIQVPETGKPRKKRPNRR